MLLTSLLTRAERLAVVVLNPLGKALLLVDLEELLGAFEVRGLGVRTVVVPRERKKVLDRRIVALLGCVGGHTLDSVAEVGNVLAGVEQVRERWVIHGSMLVFKD